MIKSMTGFGHGEYALESEKVTVEIKSVNHRYLDLNLKLPKKFSAFENQIRNRLKQDLSRGKVDIYVSYESSADRNYSIQYNPLIASEYYENLKQMVADLDLQDDITATKLASFPDVFEIRESGSDEDALWDLLSHALDMALKEFISNRENEGSRLKADLLLKLDEMQQQVDFIESRAPQILEEYKERLRRKIDELLEDRQVDENRIAMEVTLYADKICVDEELVRLKSHIKEAKEALEHLDEVGRKMDFLAQEMNRESNTILSKSTDVSIADCGITLKTVIEKIREQIQNLE
ncbi:MAG: YicC family protein [Lachnospiraceae bacterium]|nr:YicC family protein [Lachnospiraceae bacterium]